MFKNVLRISNNKLESWRLGIPDKLIPCQSHGTNFYYARAQYNVSGLEVKPRTMSKDKRSSRIFKTIDN